MWLLITLMNFGSVSMMRDHEDLAFESPNER